MSEHSPLPWMASNQFIFAGDASIPIASGHKEWATDRGGQLYAGACANAAFIVKAVNSHDALVKALEGLVSLGDTSVAEDIRKALRPHERASFDTAIRNGAVALASIKEPA